MIRQLIATLLAVFAFNAFAAADVNKASQAELESVKGIGPGLSGKILKAREAGTFKSWSDLVERVGGIGPGNAARFSQAGLTVAGGAYDGSATAAAKPARTVKTKATAADGSDAAPKALQSPAAAKTPKAKKAEKSEA